jgi:cell division septum initiation protein DivIVA
MNATAVDPEKLRELDEDTRRAWEAYRERLRELSGQEYADAESHGWDELQEQLEVLERRRQLLRSAAG